MLNSTFFFSLYLSFFFPSVSSKYKIILFLLETHVSNLAFFPWDRLLPFVHKYESYGEKKERNVGWLPRRNLPRIHNEVDIADPSQSLSAIVSRDQRWVNVRGKRRRDDNLHKNRFVKIVGTRTVQNRRRKRGDECR